MRGQTGSSLDPLVGREKELGALLDLHARSRLVTLTGPGGSGKTRLALAATASLRDAGERAWFVDCTAIDDAAIVPATIASAMSLDAAGKDPFDAVIATLGGEASMLTLDNLEQVDGAGRVATRLLDALPELSIIATSRIPLRVGGEVEFAVPPLGLPADPSPAAIAGSPAGELFLRRARAVGQATDIDAATASDIAHLLERLDGLPLAIELAAARTRAATPAEILRRLDERGPASMDERDADQHRSLGAILDWSLAQLAPDDIATLEAASICAGFDVSLAQALVPDVDVVDSIDSLVMLGLAQRTGDLHGASRFKLLETIRATVLRRIADERRASLQDRHAAYFIGTAAEWERMATTGATRELVDRFDADADNVRRALDHLESTDPRQFVVLMARLGPFWAAHLRSREGYARLMRAESLSPEPSADLARAAAGQLDALWMTLPAAEYRDLVERTLEWARAAGDDGSLVEALRRRAYVAVNGNDRALMERTVAELEAVSTGTTDQDRLSRADILATASALIDGRTSDRHVALLRAQIAELETAETPARLAFRYGNLANSLLNRGENVEAAQLARRSADLLRELDRESDVAWALAILAPALAESGRTEDAIEVAIEGAAIAVEEGFGESLAMALWAAMPVALAIGRPDLTARLWSCLDRQLVATAEADLADLDIELAERWMKRAQQTMAGVEFDLAVHEGGTAAPVAMLRALESQLRDRVPAPPERLRHGDLTRRETEVLKLLGRGLSNAEIAGRLFISPKTASVHIANIKGKLGADSRLQMALRARDLGLVDQAKAAD